MSKFANPVIQEVFDTLNSASAVTSLVTGVFDHVPQGTAYPYIEIGELIENEHNTDDTNGVVASITIHTWSRLQGRKETNSILEAIYNALHRATLTKSGNNFLSIDFVSSRSFTDADGRTRHGVIEFNIIVMEA